MISLLKSRFNLADRRALFIAGDKAFVHHWQGGALAESFVFEADDAGLAQFERYLSESPPMPVRMLVDMVEEEYRQDTIPHVFGKDRKALIERKKARLFRGTPYCHAVLQGRETEGRRDDRILFAALMNPAVIQPWVEALDRHAVPLAGICSLPLFSRMLLAKLQIRHENVLLVTLQSASGLRQSFFRNQDLKVSRLARMPRLGTVPFAGYVLEELEKLKRYLNSLRLLARDHPLDIYMLSHGEPLDDLRRHCRDGDQVRYHLLDVCDVAARVGVAGDVASPYADRIFAHLLLAGPQVNHYASAEETRHFGTYRTRVGMLAASAVILLTSAAYSGFNFIEAVALKQEALSAAQKADFYQARYDMARERLPPTAVEPRDIETAVEIVDVLARYRPTPVTAMRTVSDALAGFPRLHIDRLEWEASGDPQAPVGEQRAPVDAARSALVLPASGGSYDYYHIAYIDGHVDPFDGDYRRAIAEVNRFAEALRVQPDVYSVLVVALPLDVRSEARLEGSASVDPQAARTTFAVRLVMGVNGGES